jgi:hypothetical protein
VLTLHTLGILVMGDLAANGTRSVLIIIFYNLSLVVTYNMLSEINAFQTNLFINRQDNF